MASLPSTVCFCGRIAGSRHRVQTAPLEPCQRGADTEASLVALTHDLPLHPLMCALKARYPQKEGRSSAGIVDHCLSHGASVCRHPRRSQPRVKERGGTQEWFSKKNQETNSVAVIKPVKKHTVLITVFTTVTK